MVSVEIRYLRDSLANICEEFYPHPDMRRPLAAAIRALSDGDRSLWRVWSAEGRVDHGLLQDLTSVVLFGAVIMSDDPYLEVFFADLDMLKVIDAAYWAGQWDALYSAAGPGIV